MGPISKRNIGLSLQSSPPRKQTRAFRFLAVWIVLTLLTPSGVLISIRLFSPFRTEDDYKSLPKPFYLNHSTTLLLPMKISPVIFMANSTPTTYLSALWESLLDLQYLYLRKSIPTVSFSHNISAQDTSKTLPILMLHSRCADPLRSQFVKRISPSSFFTKATTRLGNVNV